MNIVSIGVDISEIQRIKNLIEQHKDRFLSKIFTAAEIAYCNKKVDKYPSFAARFAAKEAVLKALGRGLRDGLNWKDIEVRNDTFGRPYLKLSGKSGDLIGNRKAFLSLSHTKDNAIAFVVIQGELFNK
jgi:holo-[acyl-carrier protein] synthase